MSWCVASDGPPECLTHLFKQEMREQALIAERKQYKDPIEEEILVAAVPLWDMIETVFRDRNIVAFQCAMRMCQRFLATRSVRLRDVRTVVATCLFTSIKTHPLQFYLGHKDLCDKLNDPRVSPADILDWEVTILKGIGWHVPDTCALTALHLIREHVGIAVYEELEKVVENIMIASARDFALYYERPSHIAIATLLCLGSIGCLGAKKRKRWTRVCREAGVSSISDFRLTHVYEAVHNIYLRVQSELFISKHTKRVREPFSPSSVLVTVSPSIVPGSRVAPVAKRIKVKH